MKHTYNNVFAKHGERAGLLYEELVDAFMSGDECPTGQILALAWHNKYLHPSVTADLVDTAKMHAKQEIDEANETNDMFRIRLTIRKAIRECQPVKLKTHDEWHTVCLLTKYTGETVEAHFSTTLYAVHDLASIEDVEIHYGINLNRLADVASKIYG